MKRMIIFAVVCVLVAGMAVGALSDCSRLNHKEKGVTLVR